jgi:hypothetical protein
MSVFMMSQQDLKKAPMKPSRPSALTEGSEKIVSFISTTSKGASNSDMS